MKIKLKISLILISLFSMTLQAEEVTPIGRWQTINEETNKVESVVSIWQDSNGKLRGKIEKIFPKPGEDPNPVCDKCKPNDHRFNKPVIGMEIMNGFKPAVPGNKKDWTEGKILDPNNGEIYSCNLTVLKGGEMLEVRGYIGFSWIGRSQTWVREK